MSAAPLLQQYSVGQVFIKQRHLLTLRHTARRRASVDAANSCEGVHGAEAAVVCSFMVQKGKQHVCMVTRGEITWVMCGY